MICNKCGCRIDEGSVFCPVCGSRQGEVPEQVSAAPKAPTPIIIPVSEPAQEQVSVSEPVYTETSAHKTERPAPRKRKKEFFGAGAFALCLILILLLSASTGAFAYLYFAAIGAI